VRRLLTTRKPAPAGRRACSRSLCQRSSPDWPACRLTPQADATTGGDLRQGQVEIRSAAGLLTEPSLLRMDGQLPA